MKAKFFSTFYNVTVWHLTAYKVFPTKNKFKKDDVFDVLSNILKLYLDIIIVGNFKFTLMPHLNRKTISPIIKTGKCNFT